MPNLGGFMPAPSPNAVYGGTWSQNYGDVMNTLVAAQREAERNAFANSPSGPSFLRRFGVGSPLGVSQPLQSAPPPDLAALQGALAGALQGSDAAILNDGELVQHSGPMQSQPWYDEFLAAHAAGAPTPMLQHMGGRGLNEAELAGVQQRRQERLAGQSLPMGQRRQNVRNNALLESEQRAVRMGDMSENQQYFNELTRLQGALGGQSGGGSIMNLMLGGPQFATNMADIDQRDSEARRREELMLNPMAAWLNALGGGQAPMLADIQDQATDPTGYRSRQLIAASQSFEDFWKAVGGPRDTAKQQWMAMGKTDPDEPGFWGSIGKDVSLVGAIPIAADVPGTPHLSDLLKWFRPSQSTNEPSVNRW